MSINIGHRTTRKPFKGQADDQAWGKKEIDEARASKLFPRGNKGPGGDGVRQPAGRELGAEQ